MILYDEDTNKKVRLYSSNSGRDLYVDFLDDNEIIITELSFKLSKPEILFYHSGMSITGLKRIEDKSFPQKYQYESVDLIRLKKKSNK